MGNSKLHAVANAMTMEALADAGVLDPKNDEIDREHFGISLANVNGESLVDNKKDVYSNRDHFRTYKFALTSTLALIHDLKGS